MAAPLVALEAVGVRFGAADDPAAVTVLDGVDLAVEPGESLAVVGPSGSGKTTLLNLLGTLQRPTTGRVLFEGADLAGRSADDLARLRNERIGLVFQDHHLLPQCTALENVLLPTLAGGEVEPGAAERARALLERVGLSARADHRPAKLSGGERQRVAVVRALIMQPGLLLADEPTGALDAEGAGSLGDLLCELNAETQTALVVVTHSERLAARMGRALALEGGRLA